MLKRTAQQIVPHLTGCMNRFERDPHLQVHHLKQK